MDDVCSKAAQGKWVKAADTSSLPVTPGNMALSGLQSSPVVQGLADDADSTPRLWCPLNSPSKEVSPFSAMTGLSTIDDGLGLLL